MSYIAYCRSHKILDSCNELIAKFRKVSLETWRQEQKLATQDKLYEIGKLIAQLALMIITLITGFVQEYQSNLMTSMMCFAGAGFQGYLVILRIRKIYQQEQIERSIAIHTCVLSGIDRWLPKRVSRIRL